MSNPNQITTSGFGNPLLSFQLDHLTIKEKSDFSWGKQLAQNIESTVNGGTSSYFWVRNARWKVNRDYANGRISAQKFMDLLEFNGKTNYINLNWNCIKIVNRIVSGLVGRWMNRDEKIDITAIDTLSQEQKQDEYEQLEFVIDNREKLEQLQEQSGVSLIPQGNSIPEDKEQLNLWQAQFQRLPEEICFELGINDVLGSCGWFDTLKEKMLHDSAETGFVGTYTSMDSEGVIHVEWLKPENCFYSYSLYPDFRDTSWRGYMRTMKISELRKKYSKEFNPDNANALSEEQIFRMAQGAKQYQFYDNITWNTEWNITFLRPYDEWNIEVLEFELKTVDTESYTVVTTKENKSTLIKKGRSQKKRDNETIIDDSKINIYRGVYTRTTQMMLEWGLKKNMVRPQDPKEIGNAEFSYSFYMVQSYDMTSLAVPEKIQEPADQMIIARYKIQQLVMSMVPAGAAINWDALQNIDYGLGEANKTIDVIKMQQQTGKLYYRGRDAEQNPIPIPIIEMANTGFVGQMQALIELYNFHYGVMKDELGEDPNLVSQAAQPRVAVQNIETSQQQAEFATDYFYLAYARCMEDTARKISCLLKDSVTYGAQIYRRIVDADDLQGRIFTTKVKLLPDALQIQKFEVLMQQAMNTTPELSLFVNSFELMRIAKEDVKLSEALFRKAQKKMLLWKQQTAEQNQQTIIEGQISSAQAAEQSKQETEKVKGDIDLEKTRLQGETANKTAVITMVTSLLSKGEAIPPNLIPLVNAVAENMILPLVIENQQTRQSVAQAMQQPMRAQPPEQQPIQQPQNQQQPVAA